MIGAEGLIDSHLNERLVEFGMNVHFFIRATSSCELLNIRHLHDGITVPCIPSDIYESKNRRHSDMEVDLDILREKLNDVI
jgi:hypothetical protein